MKHEIMKLSETKNYEKLALEIVLLLFKTILIIEHYAFEFVL